MKAPGIFFLLITPFAWSQDNNLNSVRPPVIIHAETGMNLSWYSGEYSPAQVVRLTGWNMPATLTGNERPGGNSLEGNAPFFTIGFQRLLKNTDGLYWYAGFSSVAVSLANTWIQTDSTLSTQLFIGQQGDSLISGTVQRWNYLIGMNGRQANFPVGLRFQPAANGWKWLQLGLNLAPGFTFAHKTYLHSTIETGTVITSPSGTIVDRSQFENVETGGVDEMRRSPGSFFTAYASVPIHASFRPGSRWQFQIGLEPGYTFIQLEDVASRSTFMTRISFGARYNFYGK